MSLETRTGGAIDSLGLANASGARLYRRLAGQLFQDIASGKYKVGDRLPAERDLAVEHNVARPAVREAMIALEVQGLIEVRVGSGAYVRKLPGSAETPGFNATAFELTEARLLIEGEAAALAAINITDEELDQLDEIVARIAQENDQQEFSDAADRDFHLLIARSGRNAVIADMVDRMWQMRSTSPECALLHEKARDADIRPVVEEHRLIAEALRNRDADGARTLMRSHLSQVMDYLLFATEERAVADARRSVASTRARFAHASTAR